MHKYKIGQMVRIIDTPFIQPAYRHFIGAVTTIIDICDVHHLAYHLDITNGNQKLCASEYSLRPIDDKSTWEEFEKITGFNPSKEIASG